LALLRQQKWVLTLFQRLWRPKRLSGAENFLKSDLSLCFGKLVS
jgi:hypothetical protein